MGMRENEPTALLYALSLLKISTESMCLKLLIQGVGGWAKEIAFVATRVDSGCTDRGGGGATW